MGAEPVLWSNEQHAWLGAMGLTVYAEASTVTWPAAAPARPAPVFDNLAPPAPRRRAPEMPGSVVAPAAAQRGRHLCRHLQPSRLRPRRHARHDAQAGVSPACRTN